MMAVIHHLTIALSTALHQFTVHSSGSGLAGEQVSVCHFILDGDGINEGGIPGQLDMLEKIGVSGEIKPKEKQEAGITEHVSK